MRYVGVKFQEEVKTLAYRTYTTDALRLAVENTANYAGGTTLSMRWSDIINPKKMKSEKIDTRTCEEVVDDIWAHGFGKKA